MAYFSPPKVCDMSMEDIFEELRTRLYDLGEARSLVPQASEPQHLSLHRCLRTNDMIIELLRYKWHVDGDTARKKAWESRCHGLLESLRVPSIRCAGDPAGPNCPGGLSVCDSCRYHILSTGRELNTLALGFGGALFAQSDGDQGGLAQGKDGVEAAVQGSGGDSTAKSELLSAQERNKELEATVDSTKRSLEEARHDASLKAASFVVMAASYEVKAARYEERLERLETAYGGTTESIKKCTRELEPILTKKEIASPEKEEAVWKVMDVQYGALADATQFQLDSLKAEGVDKEGPPGAREKLELEKLEYRHQQVQVWMHQGEYTKAEEVAREILDERRRLSGKEDAATRSVLMDYCKILEARHKPDAAESELLQVWSSTGLESEQFREEVGMALALLKKNHGEADEAVLWYRKVVALRLRRLEVAQAADAALAMAAVPSSLRLSPGSESIFAQIWEKHSHPTLHGEADSPITPSVLACGEELAQCLVSRGNNSEAKTVLVDVWKKLEEHKDKYFKERIRVALFLAAIAQKLGGGGDDIQEIYQKVVDSAKTRSDKKASLELQYQLGCWQICRGDGKSAEKTFRAAWATLKKIWEGPKVAHGLAQTDDLVVRIGREYSQFIPDEKARDDEAKDFLGKLWENHVFSKTGSAKPSSMVMAAHQYVTLLLKMAVECPDKGEMKEVKRSKYEEASKVLKQVWDFAWPRRDKLAEGRDQCWLMVLLCKLGDSHGECLDYLGRPGEAVKVLDEVLELRKIWAPSHDEMDYTLRLLQDARGKLAGVERQKAEESTSKPEHPKGYDVVSKLLWYALT